MPEAAISGPLGEPDLTDEPWTHPVRHAGDHLGDGIGKRRGAPRKFPQSRHAISERVLGEAGSYVADIAQPFLARQAEQQRADRAIASSLTGPPATDDNFLGADVLDLHPIRRASTGEVARRTPLGDDPLLAPSLTSRRAAAPPPRRTGGVRQWAPSSSSPSRSCRRSE